MTDTKKSSACPQTERAVSELEKAANTPGPNREAYGILAVFGTLLACKDEASATGDLPSPSTPSQGTMPATSTPQK